MRSFQSGYELLDAVERSGSFDLYLLDIVMPEQNGIEVGLSIRKLDGLGLIVYLTTSPDYAVDSYLTNAFHYLLKPVRWEQMVSVLGPGHGHPGPASGAGRHGADQGALTAGAA